jgi:Mn2+/Fe2+ NRAMP family transporter
LLSRFRNIGPAALVTAAFIGPGTVTLCTLAGIESSYSLLWVIILAVITTISFQEMAARVGLCTRLGLSEAIIARTRHPAGRILAVFLIVSALFIGNAMYEAGNISGALLGIGAMREDGQSGQGFVQTLVALLAFGLLYSGKYQLIERTLVFTVGLMALAFVAAAIVASPDISEVFRGLLLPSLAKGDLLTIVGLIGTTVVPYNLFLHAATVREKWTGPANLPTARWDTYIAVAVGGLISMAIIITASSVSKEVGTITDASDLARLLEPTFGRFGRYAIAFGLFAAGLSSAITAPMGAAYAVAGLFGNRPMVYRATWMVILLCGLIFSIVGSSPVAIIRYAQVTNGILLPIIAVFLIITVNDQKTMGRYANSARQNLLAGSVLLVTLLIAYRTLDNLL